MYNFVNWFIFFQKIKDILPDNIIFHIIQFLLLKEQEFGIIEFLKKQQAKDESIGFKNKKQEKKIFFKNFAISFVKENLFLNLNQIGDIVVYILNNFEIKNLYSKKEEEYNDNLNKLLLYNYSFNNIVTYQIIIPNKLNDCMSVFVIPINNQIYGKIGENKHNNYTFLKESICIRETEFSITVLNNTQVEIYVKFLIGNNNLKIEFLK